MECAYDWTDDNYTSYPNHGAHRFGASGIRDGHDCQVKVGYSQPATLSKQINEKSRNPQQRALILAQLGLPARALELIDRLAKRLANAAEDALEPDVIAGFLIALLTTLGQISDGLRAAYDALNTTKDD